MINTPKAFIDYIENARFDYSSLHLWEVETLSQYFGPERTVMIIDTISKQNELDVDCQEVKAAPDKRFVLVRVGSDTCPASGVDIEDIQKCISELESELKSGVRFLVTHHNVDMQVIYL